MEVEKGSGYETEMQQRKCIYIGKSSYNKEKKKYDKKKKMMMKFYFSFT